jgi:general secretion pathway protein C
MEALLQRYFWLLRFAAIAVIVWLAARTVLTGVGTRYVMVLSESDPAAEAADTEGDEAGGDDEPIDAGGPVVDKRALAAVAQSIWDRNPFCPTCVPVEELPEADVPVDPNAGLDGPLAFAGEVRTSLPLKLMATMEAKDPAYSLATVFDSERAGSGIFGVGDLIRPGVLVLAIDRGTVHMRNQNKLEFLEFGNAPPPPPPPAADAPPPPEVAGPEADAIPGSEGAIDCPSENQCTIERAFIEQLLANPAALTKQARVVPSMREGQTRGFKFYGIRNGSLPKMLGLKNGDLLTAVNGDDLDSMDKAMALYTKLRRASNLSVTIDRRGEVITKEITIK